MDLANIYEYDCEYDTRCNSRFGKTFTGLIGGIILIICGILLICFNLADLNQGIYIPGSLIWTENPFWPTYGKGLWVGSLLIAVGIFGLVAHKEDTHTSIKFYGISSLISSIFTFYLMISTLVYIIFGEKARSSPRFNTWNIYNSFAMNSCMAAFSSLSCLVGLVIGLICFGLTDSLTDSRFDSAK